MSSISEARQLVVERKAGKKAIVWRKMPNQVALMNRDRVGNGFQVLAGGSIWSGTDLMREESLLFSTSRSFSPATQLSSQQCFIFPTSGIWLIYFDTKSAEDAPSEKSQPFCCWLPNILSIIRDSRRMSLKLTPARRSVYIICLHILISFNVLDIYWIFCIS